KSAKTAPGTPAGGAHSLRLLKSRHFPSSRWRLCQVHMCREILQFGLCDPALPVPDLGMLTGNQWLVRNSRTAAWKLLEERNLTREIFMRSKILTFVLALALTGSAGLASATLINFQMADTTTATVRATGNFTFDNSLQGSVLGYANLSSFNIVANGIAYDLA